MYVVFLDGVETDAGTPLETSRTLDQAFAQIACHCGYSYSFGPADPEPGWRLTLTDVERPECSPEPVYSTCIKPRDAQHDLMSQAVDGRLKGYVAISADEYRRARITRTGSDTRLHLEQSA
jgi:hypothetical protein